MLSGELQQWPLHLQNLQASRAVDTARRRCGAIAESRDEYDGLSETITQGWQGYQICIVWYPITGDPISVEVKTNTI